MSEGKHYEIRAVGDFLNVPTDRLDVCVREFGYWLAMVRAIRDAGVIVPGVLTLIPETDCFVWIDDDKGEAHVGVKTATRSGEV